MIISISYLEKIQELEKLPANLKKIINILLTAINDWPNAIINLEDFENEVYKLIRGEVNKKTMEEYISNMDYSKNPWEAESLSQLIEVFNAYEEGKQLKDILKEIHEQIEN